jgi:hypothetical protein
MNTYFFLAQNRSSGTTVPHFNDGIMRKSGSTYVVLNNVAGLGIAHDVTSEDDYNFRIRVGLVSTPSTPTLQLRIVAVNRNMSLESDSATSSARKVVRNLH